jgi:hypothetical protein
MHSHLGKYHAPLIIGNEKQLNKEATLICEESKPPITMTIMNLR